MSESWVGKRIVVVGGTGMVGKFLCQMLVGEGAMVVSMSRFPHDKEHVPDVLYVAADASDENVCCRVFKGAHVIFNLAASVGGVYFNRENQCAQLVTNFTLQVAPATAARHCNVPNFLQMSSVCVYADEHNDPAIEKNGHKGVPRLANAGYAYAKRFGEETTRLIFHGSDTKYVIVRPTNMYGEGDNFGPRGHVIPALIKRFVDGEDPVFVYNGDHSREFLHAEDGARGAIEAMRDGKGGEVYNIGTDGETKITMEALATMIGTLSRSTATIATVTDDVGGDKSRSTDCSKARRDFVWFHRIGLLEGIERTIEYYRMHVTCKET